MQALKHRNHRSYLGSARLRLLMYTSSTWHDTTNMNWRDVMIFTTQRVENVAVRPLKSKYKNRNLPLSSVTITKNTFSTRTVARGGTHVHTKSFIGCVILMATQVLVCCCISILVCGRWVHSSFSKHLTSLKTKFWEQCQSWFSHFNAIKGPRIWPSLANLKLMAVSVIWVGGV